MGVLGEGCRSGTCGRGENTAQTQRPRQQVPGTFGENRGCVVWNIVGKLEWGYWEMRKVPGGR